MIEDLPSKGTKRGGASRSLDIRPIESLIARLRDRYKPLQIWLFGSRARGEARDGSDWDLAVIVPNEADADVFDPRASGRVLRDGGWRADIVVIAAADFEEDLFTVNTVPFAVRTEGFLLYER